MGGSDLGSHLGIEVDPLQICMYQGLTVKARRATIKDLVPKAWFDGEGPYTISWAMPDKKYEMPSGKLTLSPSPKHIDLVPEEEVQLPMWYASQPMPEEAKLPITVTLNSDPIIEFKLDKLKEPYIDIAVKFIAENYTDKKTRQFRLNAKSWDDLNLIQRD